MIMMILLGGAVAFFVIAMVITAAGSKKSQGNKGSGGQGSGGTRNSGASRNQAKSTRREEMRLPYRYADDLIFVHGESVWTGIVLPTAIDEYLNATELQAMAEGPARGLLNLARGDRNVECHYRKVYRPITALEWADQLNTIAWDPTENYKAYNLRKAEYQERIGATRERNILLVKLGSLARGSNGSGVLPGGDDPFEDPGLTRALRGTADKAAAGATGVHDEYLSPGVLAQWSQVAREVHESLEGLNGAPLDREELVWLIRKPLHGDLPVPPEPVLGSVPGARTSSTWSSTSPARTTRRTSCSTSTTRSPANSTPAIRRRWWPPAGPPRPASGSPPPGRATPRSTWTSRSRSTCGSP